VGTADRLAGEGLFSVGVDEAAVSTSTGLVLEQSLREGLVASVVGSVLVEVGVLLATAGAVGVPGASSVASRAVAVRVNAGVELVGQV
jgi:hypothetical protein